jgi:hypothetical protein
VSENKFKTLRHIETVRNFLGGVVAELLKRAEEHDQSKLQSPEVEVFEEYTAKLRDCTYGSAEYKTYLDGMGVALEHHYKVNRHHPEHFGEIAKMNLIDITEMLCDWKAATLRHANGDIYKSIEFNQKRFGYSDEMKQVLINTVRMLDLLEVKHFAEES